MAYGDNIQERPAEDAPLSWGAGGEGVAHTMLEQKISEEDAKRQKKGQANIFSLRKLQLISA